MNSSPAHMPPPGTRPAADETGRRPNSTAGQRDISGSKRNLSGAKPNPSEGQPNFSDGQPMFDLIELLFFAYRDFVGDADRLLESYQFGRAHHRILHFVNRQPGLTIAELLDILSITKQSLNRVLKELVEKEFISARPGENDRRQRHLFATDKGSELAGELAQLQSRRLAKALEGLPEQGRELAVAFLLGIINDGERDKVRSLISGPYEAADNAKQH